MSKEEENNNKKKNIDNVVEKTDKKKIKKTYSIVHAEYEDSIENIFHKISQARKSKIRLFIPKEADIFTSIVNLKILKKKIENEGKSFSVITKDIIGEKFCISIGIRVYKKIDDNRELSVKVNTIKKYTKIPKEDLRKENKTSIFETVKEAKKEKEKIKNKKNKKTESRNKEKEKNRKESIYFLLHSPSRIWLILFFLASTCVLLFVFYITVPNATIFVTPKHESVMTKTNFIIAVLPKHNKACMSNEHKCIKAAEIRVKIEKTIEFNSTGKKEEILNARGRIIVYNKTNSEKTFMPSRFKSKNGIIFRTTEYIRVPPAKADGTFGSTEAEVVADERDENGKIIAERGNIGPSKFDMPALSEKAKELYYAESKGNMQGGGIKITKFVSEIDLKSAERKAEKELEKLAFEKLKIENKRRNQKKNINNKILEYANSISKENIEVNVPWDLKEKEIEKFNVHAKIDFLGVTYYNDELLNKMKRELEKTIAIDKKLVKIDENSLRLHLVSNLEKGKYKITATIEGTQKYDLSKGNEIGDNNDLKMEIISMALGKNIKKAEIEINNYPKIDHAKIENKPFWTNTLPHLSENIDVVIKEL